MQAQAHKMTLRELKALPLDEQPPVRRAILLAGGFNGTAQELQVTQEAVRTWFRKNQLPNKATAIVLENIIKGAVKCKEMAPEFFEDQHIDF